jgi:selenophosphate synthase
LFDPQTAGGLLISLSEENAEKFIEQISDAKIIGQVEEFKDFLIEVK